MHENEEKERDAWHQARDHSQERQQVIDKVVPTALKQATNKLEAKFMALLNAPAAPSMLVAIKTSSGATGISAMSPFDSTRDKTIYQ